MQKQRQRHLRAEKKRGETRAGAPAREIREKGREDGERKKEEEKEGGGESRRAEKGEGRG